MNELPYMAGPAMHHLWAERAYARLQADIVEANLTARARTVERAADRRARVRDRLSLLGRLRPVRRPEPEIYCARAAARSAYAVRPAGGVR